MKQADQEERRKQKLSYPVNSVGQNGESHLNASYYYILTDFLNILVFLSISNSIAFSRKLFSKVFILVVIEMTMFAL